MAHQKVSSSLADTMRGFAVGQVVFVVLSSRKKNASPLALAIGKDDMERLARKYRRDGFPTANLRMARVVDADTVDMIEPAKKPPAPSDAPAFAPDSAAWSGPPGSAYAPPPKKPESA